ncbi:rrf2 family protein, putative transcriptional regulator [Thermanaerovibrio velox DSM 12556]|uniref:Rrf2 family protein, putative transcriptional regulator n=1 Tax=Thermanaerovibrio velox DSM 12556 TaxID=926567 RepID=H0UQ68_9BACT|nr:rrf2 family protein, putative transcriptional regulator [Thermanaerovibrio velox DSM 12556]
MAINQKCQYALRALYELSLHYPSGPVKIAHIAHSQGIPKKFLEGILGLLKSLGYVKSHRGKDGGYSLAKPPGQISVGEVIRGVQGPFSPVECIIGEDHCQLKGRCSFRPLWERAKAALEEVYDHTTFQDLLDQDKTPTEGERLESKGGSSDEPD